MAGFRVTITDPDKPSEPDTVKDFETFPEATKYVADTASGSNARIDRIFSPDNIVVDGNPGGLGPGADPLDVIIEEGENVTVENRDGESLVSWDENGERHTVLVDEAGSLSHWDSQGLVAHEPGRGIVEGNPGSEPLHEALAEIATEVAYEAEVVAAAADEVDDDEIAAGAEDQAEAMDEAAEALDEAAEVAAEVAADVFIETGSPTVEVADTDSPEGEIVSGEIETETEAVAAEILDDIEEVIEDAVDDIPPDPQHWYKRRWVRV